MQLWCKYIKIIYVFLIVVPISFTAWADPQQIQVEYKDKDLNGNADQIFISGPNSKISIVLRDNKPEIIEIYRDIKRTLVQTKYELKNNAYQISYGYATNQQLFRGSSELDSNACIRWNGSRVSDLKNISDRLSPVTSEECYDHTKVPEKISSALKQLSNDSEKFSDCLASFSVKASNTWLYLEDHYKNFKYCIVSDQSKDNKPAKCEGLFLKNSKQIKISKACLVSTENTKKILQHELLHSSDLLEEPIANCAGNSCPSKDNFQTCYKNKSAFASSISTNSGKDVILQVTSSPSGGATAEASAQIANNTTIQVPKAISAGAVPQPAASDLRVAGGSRSISVPSNSTSFPAQMLRFAENTIAPTTAYAAPIAKSESSPSTSVASSNSSRSAGTNNSVRKITKSSSTSASRGIASTSPVAPANISESTTSALKKSNEQIVPNSNSGQKIAQKNGSAVTSPSRGGTGAVGTSVIGGSGGGGSANKSANKSGATGGQRKTASTDSYSSDQLVRILKQDSYNEVKRKLQQDPQFIEALRNNAITIYNTKGEQIGAPAGRIIFSDTGNRFVQGK